MNRPRPFFCAIASKDVNISLRAGGGLREPASMYVRCDDRDCQYVDDNRPPCPLTPTMFDDGSEQILAHYLQEHAGSQICYGCLTAVLGLTHAQVRRASWRIKDNPGVSIGPGRCFVCRRRGVILGVHQDCNVLVASPQPDELLEITPSAGAPSVVEALTADPRSARVIAFLAASRGDAFCAGCIALSTDLGLADCRRLIGELGEIPELERLEAACSACGRRQQTIRTRPPGR